MAKRKTPPRYKSGRKKGQFMSKRARAARKSSRSRKNPGRTVAKRSAAPKRRRSSSSSSRKRAAPKRRRSARRNPPRRRRLDIIGSLTGGSIEAVQILIGKAAARSVPDLAGLPKQGNVGLAIQAGVALATGWLASMFLSENAARAMMAGGLTAPLETLIVSYRVPWLGAALNPVTATNNVGAYVAGRRLAPGMGAYVRAPRPILKARGLGAYVSSAERGIPAAYSD